MNYCVVPDASTAAIADDASVAACAQFCTNGGTGCEVIQVNAQQLVRCSTPCTGRRPPGLIGDKGPGGCDAATYLEELAYLEAASIYAFGTLHDELSYHRAPCSLLRAVERAKRDEVRHARVMRSMARRCGAVCRKPRVVRKPPRSIVAIAIENAVEGCVRETYGALVAARQALVADIAMRATMKTIARDEARHAALAWRIGAWLDRRLLAAERRRVAEARQAAVEQIAAAVKRESSSSLRRFAGLPDAREAQSIVAQMRATVWRC
jgi:hypothetical protein